MPQNKIIYVKWHDSTSWDYWRKYPLVGDTELCIVESIGYLVDDNPDRIIIACSISDAGHCDGIIAIPKTAILKKRYIK